MTAITNKKALELLGRLKAINYDEPYWNEKEVVACFKRQYAKLGLTMPPVEVAGNSVIGFKIAWGEARGAAWGAARDAAWDAARDAARGAAWGAARGAARDAARDAAWGAARDAAWDAAWDAADSIGALEALPDHPEVVKFVKIEIEVLKALENGLDIYFPMKNKLILVPMPRLIVQNDKLHYDHGKAVEWKDGMGFYFLRGVQFDETLYHKIVNLELTAEETLQIRNADQRAAALSMLRPDRLLSQMRAKHIDTGTKGTKLYRVKNFMDTGRTEYCMYMVDPSNGREFIEWVEPSIGQQANADLCQAAAFGIPLEDYLLMEQEA